MAKCGHMLCGFVPHMIVGDGSTYNAAALGLSNSRVEFGGLFCAHFPHFP
jgi:hypothetical protein